MLDPTATDCCDYWYKIRPLLGWFQIAPPDGELVMPVIGSAVPGAPRVNFCPSCGAPVRNTTWTLDELIDA